MDKLKMIMLCGIPGCGKSTYASDYVRTHANENWIILSSDAIRAEVFGDENDQTHNGQVFDEMRKRALNAFNEGYNIIYDATNIARKYRISFLSILPSYVRAECHIIWASIEDCIARDSRRERTVGKEVIDRMLKNFQMPYYDEGFDKIVVERPYGWDFGQDVKYLDELFANMKIPHENHHHSLDIYEHSYKAAEYAINQKFSTSIYQACLLHDCGKPYVKAFFNAKGEPSNEAHYYGHQGVSTWIALGVFSNAEVLWLISNHMAPYLNEKYYQNLPKYLKNKIDLIHKCDMAAH